MADFDGLSNTFVQQNYQRDPRAIMAALLMQNAQQGINATPTPSAGAALAKALSVGLGAASQMGVAGEYQNRDAAARQTMADALEGLTKGTSRTLYDPGIPGADGQPDAMAPKTTVEQTAAPGLGTMAKILAGNPDTASYGMQQAIAAAMLGEKSRIELTNEFAKQGKRIVGYGADGSPVLGPITGYGTAAAANEQPVAKAKEAGTLQAQADGRPAVIRAETAPKVEQENALNSGTAATAGAKAATVAAATAPVEVKKAVDIAAGTAPIDVAKQKDVAKYKNDLDTGRLMSPDEVKAAGLPEGSVVALDGKNEPHVVYNPNTPLSPDTIAKYTLVKEGANAAERLKQEIGNPSAKELMLAKQNGALASYLNSAKGLQVKQLAEIAIGNRLRITSGAAVTQGEIEQEMSKYFPQPGDDNVTAQRKIDALTNYYGTFGSMVPPNARAGMPTSGGATAAAPAVPQVGQTVTDTSALPEGTIVRDASGVRHVIRGGKPVPLGQ